MSVNINYFLNKKYDEIQIDRAVLTEELYENVADPRLKYIFSVLHQEFNSLIRFMYSKSNHHYNAEPSRLLLKYISIYEDVKYNLKNTANAFELDSEYDNFLKYCKTFLVMSGGSPIPDPLKKIQLKDYEPIFFFSQTETIKHETNESTYTLKIIGEGSYAQVFKYYDDFYCKDIVVKRAKKELNEKELERFKKEYEIMKSLCSPYILHVFNYDNEKNQYYAEYVNTTLYDYIKNNNQKLSLIERYRIIMQVLNGFEYIHQKQMLHRDISLTNILIKIYDDTVICKIADFGLVKEKNSTLTSLESEIKGSLNDESNLRIVGFSNYSILHETFALTRLILFVLTGKTNLEKVKNEDIREFVIKGTNGDLDKRFKDIKEVKIAVNNLFKKISKK